MLSWVVVYIPEPLFVPSPARGEEGGEEILAYEIHAGFRGLWHYWHPSVTKHLLDRADLPRATRMKVTVTTLSDDIFVLDVSEELELENFKAFCEIESGVPAHEIVIAFNGLPLMDDKKSLKDHGIRDGDAVILQHMHHSGTDLSVHPNNGGQLPYSSII